MVKKWNLYIDEKKELNLNIRECDMYSSFYRGSGCDRLADFYKYLVDTYIFLDVKMDLLMAQRIRNQIKKVATMIFWPVVKSFSSYPSCTFYVADNELLTIQGEMLEKYVGCLHTLAGIVRGNEADVDNMYSLAELTVSKFNDNLCLVEDARKYLMDAMTGMEAVPIDYTKLDLGSFLEFFDGMIGERECLDSGSKTFKKIGNK